MPCETTGSEEKSRSPRCSRERSADEEPPESTLKIHEFTVSHGRPGWEDEAFRIFQGAGFVIVNGVLTDDQSEKVLKSCEEVAQKIIEIDPIGNRARGRYSIGTAFSSRSSLHLPEISEHLLGGAGVILEPLLCKIFHKDGKADFQCYSGGGDFVVPGVEEYQPLHGDIEMKSGDEMMPPPFLSVNFCVQALTPWNGPIRMVPGKTRLDWDGRKEPVEWRHSRLFPVPAGAALLRDVRILHGGTPNRSKKIRFLPSLEFVSDGFRIQHPEWWPPTRCLSQRTFDALDERMQRRCKELIADDGDVQNVKIVCLTPEPIVSPAGVGVPQEDPREIPWEFHGGRKEPEEDSGPSEGSRVVEEIEDTSPICHWGFGLDLDRRKAAMKIPPRTLLSSSETTTGCVCDALSLPPWDGRGKDPLLTLLEPKSERTVRYGDAVCLRAFTGRCVDVEGTKVSARWYDRGDWQTFLLCPSAASLRDGVVGLGSLVHEGDTVRLLAHTGACLAVSQNGKVTGRHHRLNSAELVVRLKRNQRRPLLHSDEIYLQCRSSGRFLDVEGAKVAARFQHFGDWQTFVVEKCTNEGPRDAGCDPILGWLFPAFHPSNWVGKTAWYRGLDWLKLDEAVGAAEAPALRGVKRSGAPGAPSRGNKAMGQHDNMGKDG
eukprot:s274_g6.t3